MESEEELHQNLHRIGGMSSALVLPQKSVLSGVQDGIFSNHQRTIKMFKKKEKARNNDKFKGIRRALTHPRRVFPATERGV